MSKGAKVNAQNGTDTAALHMALEYDYWFVKVFIGQRCGRFLEEPDGNTAEVESAGKSLSMTSSQL